MAAPPDRAATVDGRWITSPIVRETVDETD